MPTSSPTLTSDDVAAVTGRALHPRVPGRGSVGLEVEWIVGDRADPTRPVSGREVLDAVAGALPCGGSAGRLAG